MSSPETTRVESSFEKSFENAMTYVWHASGRDFRRATADQVHQRSIPAVGQISEPVDEHQSVIVENVCQRIEGSLNRVAERLEASFDEKFFAALRAASYDTQCQEVPGPKAPSTAFMALYQANAARPGSTAMSTAAGSCKQLESDVGVPTVGDQSDSNQIWLQSADQQVSNLDKGRELSASVGQISPTPIDQKTVFGQATHEDAGKRTAAASTHLSSHVNPPLSSMSDHAYIDGVMKRATLEIHHLQEGDKSHSWFQKAYQRKVNQKSWLHEVFITFGFGAVVLPTEPPKNTLVYIASSLWFRGAAMSMVMLSTIFCAYESDQQARRYLRDTQETDPHWWFFVDLVFDIVFTVELLVRLAAYRSWFFVDPDGWGWNLIDLFLVGVGIFSALTEGVKLYFIRALRIIKVFRTARVVHMARAFPELRKLLYAIFASISSLFWAVVFLLLTMFVFSILILQVVSAQPEARHSGLGVSAKDLNDLAIKDQVRDQFDGMLQCFKTLFVVVCGSDWLDPHDALSNFGIGYSVIMPAFVVFVNVGVMNVVVGVFADAASRCTDRELIAQDEIGATEDFIGTMLELWRNLAEEDGESSWESFKQYFHDETIQAYLASQQIDARHPHLLFDLIDTTDPNGKVDIREFVLGLLRCRGQARHLHSKVIMHVLSALASDLECVRHEVRQIAN